MTDRILRWMAAISLALVPTGQGAVLAAGPSAELLVADFDTGAKPNNLGGDFGAWSADPSDPMQGCIESFERAQRFGGKGWSLRLIYSVASSRPAYAGLWMKLQGADASSYDTLRLRVKGDTAMGYTTTFKIELKDAVGQVSHFYLGGVSDEWQDLAIPLGQFSGMANRRRLAELVVVFEDRVATAKQGVIYLDDIRFTREAS